MPRGTTKKAAKPIFKLQLNDEQLVHVIAGLGKYERGLRKNAKAQKARIRMTKEFVELQVFSDVWRKDRKFQKAMKAKYLP